MFTSKIRSSAVLAAAFISIVHVGLPSSSQAATPCGGDFKAFLDGVAQEARSQGRPEAAISATLAAARIDRKVLSRDRAQGVFKQTFLTFSKRSVSGYRLKQGAANLRKYASTFQRAEREYGVPGPVIAAFWGLETDYGAVQGDFNTVSALATLAHDCRRPQLFRPQLIAAIEMVEHGDLDPRRTTGAWAGEIGQVQMLPEDIVRFGVDGDGNGHVDLKNSAPDTIMTAARFIRHLGWRPGEPWLQEITLPSSLPWEKTGLHYDMTVGDWAVLGVRAREGGLPSANLPAALLLPQGRKGPAFLAYPNFRVYLEWNKSFIYTTSAAYFATRLNGAKRYDAGNPGDGLSDRAMKDLQTRLRNRGHDVGKIDGILGAGTRAAVRTEQMRLGLPADGWPTGDLLNRL
ncbi:lytic murein transglycosylase [Stappia sp. ES.058]|uniref:lytic murein transglycosylase n=1 Tax=Stappia sp. ES.058 TaxID=1881061 RepID=UPI0008797672|nr:lytic murein transglycosylase [Stappia sp. ES.058]SDU07712.1 lytic murein transglycosylase [Stappia sp. ES.058]